MSLPAAAIHMARAGGPARYWKQLFNPPEGDAFLATFSCDLKMPAREEASLPRPPAPSSTALPIVPYRSACAYPACIGPPALADPPPPHLPVSAAVLQTCNVAGVLFLSRGAASFCSDHTTAAGYLRVRRVPDSTRPPAASAVGSSEPGRNRLAPATNCWVKSQCFPRPAPALVPQAVLPFGRVHLIQPGKDVRGGQGWLGIVMLDGNQVTDTTRHNIAQQRPFRCLSSACPNSQTAVLVHELLSVPRSCGGRDICSGGGGDRAPALLPLIPAFCPLSPGWAREAAAAVGGAALP